MCDVSPNTSDCPSGYFGLPVRLLLTLLLLTSSVSGTWGQDYSGTYYIASDYKSGSTYQYDPNNLNNNYYLCPSDGWIYYKKKKTVFSGSPAEIELLKI